MLETLDELDIALIDRVKATQCVSMIDVIRPFLLERSESVLRTRIRGLALRGLIRTTKTIHGRIKCLPVNENSKADGQTSAGKIRDRNTQHGKPGVHRNDSYNSI